MPLGKRNVAVVAGSVLTVGKEAMGHQEKCSLALSTRGPFLPGERF